MAKKEVTVITPKGEVKYKSNVKTKGGKIRMARDLAFSINGYGKVVYQVGNEVGTITVERP